MAENPHLVATPHADILRDSYIARQITVEEDINVANIQRDLLDAQYLDSEIKALGLDRESFYSY